MIIMNYVLMACTVLHGFRRNKRRTCRDANLQTPEPRPLAACLEGWPVGCRVLRAGPVTFTASNMFSLQSIAAFTS